MNEHRKLTLLHFYWSGGIGGTERALFQLVREQTKNQMLDVGVVFAQPRGYYYDLIKKLNCVVYSLDLRNAYDISKMPRCIRIAEKYSLHHFHSAEVFGVIASILSGSKTRVYTQRGARLDYPLRKKLMHGLMGYFLRHYFHGYSGNTLHAARRGARFYNIPPDRFTVTYNGIDFSLLVPKRRRDDVCTEVGFSKDDIIIGTSAHLRPWKRIDKLLHAKSALSNHTVKILIIGDGPDRERLESLSKELKISDDVVFIGMKEDFVDYLNVIDVFALPSMDYESFGNAMVEAMYLRKPCIIFADGGGLNEHIEDGVNGFIVKNDKEYAKKIDFLVRNEHIRKKMGEEAKKHVEQKYSLDNMLMAYAALYQQALDTR